MTEQAWKDGPTWESIVRRVVRRQIQRQRDCGGLLFVRLVNHTGLGARQAERLCRECGYDPETGRRVKP